MPDVCCDCTGSDISYDCMLVSVVLSFDKLKIQAVVSHFVVHAVVLAL